MQRRTMHVAVIAAATIGTMIPAGAALAGNGRQLHGAAAREQAFAAYAAQHGIAARKTDGDRGGEDGDLEDQAEQYAFERSAPGTSVSGQAVISAVNTAKSLPTTGGAWREMTTVPYNAQPSNFTDPFWGNEGAGFSIVGDADAGLPGVGHRPPRRGVGRRVQVGVGRDEQRVLPAALGEHGRQGVGRGGEHLPRGGGRPGERELAHPGPGQLRPGGAEPGDELQHRLGVAEHLESTSVSDCTSHCPAPVVSSEGLNTTAFPAASA